MNTFWGSRVTLVHSIVLFIESCSDSRAFHVLTITTTPKWQRWDVKAVCYLIVVNISQRIVSNHHTVHLQLTQCDM